MWMGNGGLGPHIPNLGTSWTYPMLSDSYLTNLHSREVSTSNG